MNLRSLIAVGAFGAAALAPTASMATGSVTGQFIVDATVPPNCEVTAPGGQHFGTYDPLVANFTVPATADAGFFMKCTLGTVPTMPASSSDYKSFMTDAAGDKLNYELQYGAGLSAPWGINNVKNIYFHGIIAAGQDVPVGSYSGTASIEVDF